MEALTGCSPVDAPTASQPAAVEVGYVVATAADIPLTSTYTGRATAQQMAEVRPQISGLIQRRLFREGAMVQQGQAMYQIDPSVYAAAVGEAEATLQRVRAASVAAEALAGRYRTLIDSQAISRQALDDAVAAADQAKAAVGEATAALETARISLRFTTVPAPMTGRIGRSLVTVGGLVTSGQAEPLAVIQQLDPIYVDVQQSVAELTRLRRGLAAAAAAASGALAQAEIFLPDGSRYEQTGTLEFSEVTADPSTGTITLRIRVPNPDGLIIPGTFVRAGLTQSVQQGAFLVPQQALARDATGAASVWVVADGDKAERRSVVAPRTEGAHWVVTEGLRVGDRIVVQGGANLRADVEVRPVPMEAPPAGDGQARPPAAADAGN